MLKPVPLFPARTQRDSLSSAEWVLADKLEPPMQRVSAVPREALLERLDRASEIPLTVLLAPAGFGKTTLLAQWRLRLRERGEVGVGWLSLDEDDGESGRFLAYLALALAGAGLELGPALQADLAQWDDDLDPAATLTALIRQLRASPRRLVLVLDDYDRCRSTAIDALLTRLVEYAGSRLHLLLATRAVPSLPLSRLAAHGCVQRFSARDLAMDAGETRRLLGPQIPEDTARLIHQRTEGWAVALQLAALWIAGDERRRDDVAQFSGRSVGIAGYLAEQVLTDLDSELRDFLLQTSVLERFDAALADALRERHDSGALLARLHHFQGLLIALDSEHDGFRYHPLFADYLRQQLERRDASLPPRLHRRAAAWYAERGGLLEAVRHAMRAGATELAIGYVARAGSWQLLLQYGPAYLRSLLRPFERKLIRDTPTLNLTQAYLHMKLGEFAHAQLLLERFRAFSAEEREPHERDYTVVVALLRDLLDEICPDPQGATRIAAQAAAMDADDYLGRGALLCISATTALGRGDFAGAERYARQGEDAMHQADSPVGANYALLHQGLSHYYRGRLDRAEAIYRQAQALAERHHGIDRMLQAVTTCLLAQLQCERGRYDMAADGLDEAIVFIEQHDGWLDVFASAYETALTLARQRDRSGRAALALLEHIEQVARRRRLSRLLELTIAWRLEVLLDLPASSRVDLFVASAGCESNFIHALQHDHAWRHSHALGLALARWHRQAGRGPQALLLLHSVEANCAKQGNRCQQARAQARMALAHQQRGDIASALPPLRAALDYIAGTLAWQVVLELGLPAKALLRLARQSDPEAAPGTTRALTIQTLLDKLSDEAPALDDFSERELEVLAELGHGHSNKRIARRLAVSENTVKFHLKNLYRKLGTSTRDTALAAALQRGLIRAGDEGTGADQA